MLSIRALSFSYNSKPALSDISLDVKDGEILAVIGPNGAGKTTLIKAVSGVLRPQTGKVLVSGRDVSVMDPARRARLMAVVPQARKLPPDFTVWQTVQMGRTPYLGWLGKLSQEDFGYTQQALKQTALLAYAGRRIDQLSGGEQQRALLARALAQDCPILLLDEPTAHLDLHYQSDLLNLIRRLATEQELAVLMALHDLNQVAQYADQVALLLDGRLQALGTPEEVLTSDNLTRAYQVPLHVVPHPYHGTPLILVDNNTTPL
jgi:iron complex transport system ATP-binding protein